MSKKRKPHRMYPIVDEIVVRFVKAPPKIPPGAIPADQSKHAPNNSCDPPEYYRDVEFDCVDCGKHQVWTAAQQQWWYEVAKGSIYTRAIRCRACRSARRLKQRPNSDSAGGDAAKS